MTVSIIVPVYNTEKYLGTCIESCLSQTYTDLEIILIDDGSTDSSPQVLSAYACRDSRIRIISKKNEGVAVARQVALQYATGKWVFFLDSDDYLLPASIEVLVRYSDQANMIVGTYSEKGENGRYERRHEALHQGNVQPQQYLSDLLGKKVRWALWGNLIERTLLDTVIMPPFRVGEDASVLVQLICRSENIFFIPDPVYVYLQRPGSAVHTRSARNLTDILKFRLWIRDYLIQSGYKISRRQLDIFIADGYAESLLQGGYRYMAPEWKEELNKLDMDGLAYWQVCLIRAYAVSSQVGTVVRFFIRHAKKVLVFIEKISG